MKILWLFLSLFLVAPAFAGVDNTLNQPKADKQSPEFSLDTGDYYDYALSLDGSSSSNNKPSIPVQDNPYGAVQFDSQTAMGTLGPLLGAHGAPLNNSPYGIISLWLKGFAASSGLNIQNSNQIVTNMGENVCEQYNGQCSSFDNSGGGIGRARFNLGSITQAGTIANAQYYFSFASTTLDIFQPTIWQNYIYVWDTSNNSNPCFAMYQTLLGGSTTQIAGNINKSAPYAAFLVGLSNVRGLNLNGFPTSSPWGTADWAEVFEDVGTNYCKSNAISSTAILQKFVTASGIPANLGVNGTLPFGHRPLLFLSGNATAFQTNGGYGGPFQILRGSSGATAPVYNKALGYNQATGVQSLVSASYGPAGPPAHTVVKNWITGPVGANGASSVTVTSNSNVINSGDWLGLVCSVSNQTMDKTGVLASSGFTSLIQGTNTNTAYTRLSVLYKVAGGSETGSYTVTYSAAPYGMTCLLMDYGNVASVDQTSVSTSSATALSGAAPSLTPTASNDTLIDLLGTSQVNQQNGYNWPLGITPRWSEGLYSTVASSNRVPDLLVGDEVLTSAAATGAQTFTWTNNSVPAVAAAIALTPN